MFERYRFEDPQNEARPVNVGALSYLAAALMGSIFVLWKAGMAGFLAALLSNFFIVLALVVVTGVTSFGLPADQQLVVLAVTIPALLTIQSVLMVGIVAKTYRNRGWIVHEWG